MNRFSLVMAHKTCQFLNKHKTTFRVTTVVTSNLDPPATENSICSSNEILCEVLH